MDLSAFLLPNLKILFSEVLLFAIKLNFNVGFIGAGLEHYFCMLHLLHEHKVKGPFSIYFDRLNSSEYLSL